MLIITFSKSAILNLFLQSSLFSLQAFSSPYIARRPTGAGLVSSRTISVPMPLLVKISRSKAWGSRPSIMWVFRTPASRLVKHASTLGIIPRSITPGRVRVAASVRERGPSIRLAGSFSSLAENSSGIGGERRAFPPESPGQPAAGRVGIDVQAAAFLRLCCRRVTAARARRRPDRGFRSGGTSHPEVTSPARA